MIVILTCETRVQRTQLPGSKQANSVEPKAQTIQHHEKRTGSGGKKYGTKSNMTSNNILVICFLPKKKVGKVRERGGGRISREHRVKTFYVGGKMSNDLVRNKQIVLVAGKQNWEAQPEYIKINLQLKLPNSNILPLFPCTTTGHSFDLLRPARKSH